ncbi:MAG: phytanoyl-CoA dioxygenase family protein [Myxococcota bacterium]
MNFSLRLRHTVGDVELAKLVELARDERYWLSLGGQVTSTMASPLGQTPAPPEGSAYLERLHEVGYFHAKALIEEGVRRAALLDIERVHRAGWPRVFAFVYDGPWRVVRAPRLLDVIRATLGPGAWQVPAVWIHHVPPVGGARGWGPHRDAADETRTCRNGGPARLTAWLALTDATLDNGCLHVVPRGIAPRLVKEFVKAREAPLDEVTELLHGCRALPAEAGTLIAWRPDLLHWGGVATGEGSRARVSVSLEFAHEEDLPRHDDGVPLPLHLPVTFSQRLHLIGRALLAYGTAQDREPHAARFTPLGEHLLGA